MIARTHSMALRIATPLLVAALAACGGGDEAATSDTLPSQTMPAPADTAAGMGAATADGAMLDPDAASRDALLAVAGMTPAAADSLVAGRPYANMLAVDSVLAPLMSEGARDSVYARVWKPIDLNNAADAEILLIPGVGDRMLREFKEYRPYTSIEVFRREMGKYVDDDEVARLERYVAIR